MQTRLTVKDRGNQQTIFLNALKVNYIETSQDTNLICESCGQNIVGSEDKFAVVWTGKYEYRICSTCWSLLPVSCPFCKDDDFDILGLKYHLYNGHCNKF